MNRGILLALSAYIFWGLHPIYWKFLKHVPSTQIVSHRIIWSLLFFVLILSFRKEWKGLFEKVKASDNKLMLFFPGLLIGSNWAVYIWAVNANFIIETSLGYFISPLVIVFLGVIFLSERLRYFQWFSIAMAGCGVIFMAVVYGNIPWISLYLAGTWGCYGLLRKKSNLTAVEGLTLETAMLSVFAFSYLTYIGLNGETLFFHDAQTSFMLIGAGIISGLPLIIFIVASKLINLSLIGILQYIYPTIIFAIGVFIYDEPFTTAKLVGFTFVWLALIVYSIESTIYLRKKAVAAI